MSTTLTGQQFIGGERSGQGQASLPSVAAADGSHHDLAYFQATVEEVEQAVAAASAAYPPFRQLAPEARAQFLEAIADELDALGDDFINDVVRETALPAARINGERGRTSGQLRLFAEVLRRGDFLGARIDLALPERSPLPRPDLRQVKMGLGPVAVFGASNFPLAFSVAGGDTASALAAGCPVVVKAHSSHVMTAEWVAQAIERAARSTAMPAGVFNMIYGSGVGKDLVQAPGIKAVGFTGSLSGGRALCDLAAKRPEPIPVFAEMSSINPVWLMPAALRVRGERIATDLAASVTLGCGQFCTNPGLVLAVDSPETEQFITALGDALASADEQVMLNRQTLEHYQQGVARLAELPEVTQLTGGSAEPGKARAHLFRATPDCLFRSDRPLEDEVFGPTTIVVTVPDSETLARYFDVMQGQLTVTLHAEPEDLSAHAEMMTQLEHRAGRLLLNSYPTGVEVCDAMVHGGPYPATSDARGTSVGTLAIDRYLRPVCFQNYPDAFLPRALQNANPLGLMRLVNGQLNRDALG
ncbi:aldehyde dehydrogenase (NADP(+)) [Vreelandella maris]|jgi:NADP-dependent aldehyde dehydrogenase|uniref:Aldehyde dehydrogenase (NADP(+)) n=1 Tax=Vreelandella maris TaxID=2729617 RepID=A0A7Y6V838_9GAMM|nr:aldehyde dehydrogenase (NADP(+)) [Halomonas maris]NVF13512.1 aldehyde dehydrogenase (NADP(+)) [Halomonas maris]